MDQCDNPRVPDVMADMAKGISPHDAFARVGGSLRSGSNTRVLMES